MTAVTGVDILPLVLGMLLALAMFIAMFEATLWAVRRYGTPKAKPPADDDGSDEA